MEERRTIAIRHERFNAALITSVLVNSHRSEDTDPVSAFDFLPGFEMDQEEDEKRKARKAIVHAIRVAFAQETYDSPEEVQRAKARTISNMRRGNVEDPEGIFNEAFPNL